MQQRPKRTISRWIWAGALLLLVFFFMFRSCNKDKTLRVSTFAAQPGTIIETVDESGKVFPVMEMRITTEPGCLVEQLYAREGDTVSRGQLLAIVKTEQLSTVSGGSQSMPDLQKLAGGNMPDPAAIAQLLKSSQQPALPAVKRQQRLIRITAPMSGVIGSLPWRTGERVATGELGRIQSAGQWEIRVDVGEADIVKVGEGNNVVLEADAFPGKKFSGRVQRIASSGGGQQNNIPGNLLGDVSVFKVYITIDPPSLAALRGDDTTLRTTLRGGMNVRARIQTRQRDNVLALPINAVTTRQPDSLTVNGQTGYHGRNTEQDVVVFVYDKGTVMKRKVTTGIQDINFIEITSGLQKGEQVVNEPYDAIDKILTNGMKVKVVKEAELFRKAKE